VLHGGLGIKHAILVESFRFSVVAIDTLYLNFAYIHLNQQRCAVEIKCIMLN
jgi:hypothetical protein